MSRLSYLLHLALESAWNRRSTLLLIVCSIALSTLLLLGIEKLRSEIRESFVQSVSGTDLVVGARGSDVELVLYALFHLGGVANNLSMQSVAELAADPRVAFTIPVSLGDSHKDYPVVATNAAFYTQYRFRGGKHLAFSQGRSCEGLFDLVLGADVARTLGYHLGDPVELSHGAGNSHGHEHKDCPFHVVGILEPTGTPVDRSLYIGLEAMEAMHLNWHEEDHDEDDKGHHEEHETSEEHLREKVNPGTLSPQDPRLKPKAVTALLVGLTKRSQVFQLQREINEAKGEARSAVLPGVAMNQIWEMINIGEKALLLMSVLVTAVGLVGLAAAILAGLGERRRELAILRSAGASPKDILLLMAFEGGLLVFSGVLSGALVLYALIACFASFVSDRFGVALTLCPPSSSEWLIILGICVAGVLASLIPAFRAYRMSLADGLTVSV